MDAELETRNLTSYDDGVLKVLIDDNGGSGITVPLLTAISILVFLTIVIAVSYALKRYACAKSEKKITSPEDQIESGDLRRPPVEQKLQGPSVDRFLTSNDLPWSATEDLHPEPPPVTSVSHYHHEQGQQQQQQRQQLPLSAMIVSKQDQSLLACSNVETNSRNGRGRIWFSVTFDTTELHQKEINIHIFKIELDVSPSDLIGVERWKEAFVCVFLLPDESQQQRTMSVARTGTSFIVDQNIVFKLGPTPCLTESSPPLLPSVLRLSVYQIDHRRLRHTLGHVIVNLDDRCDLASDDVMVCKDLISDEALSNYNSLGEIRFSLTYDPEANRLKVTFIDARGLRQLDPNRESFVLVELLIGDQLQKTKRISNRKWKTLHVSNDEDPACPTSPDHLTYKQSVHFTLPVNCLGMSRVRVSILTTADRTGQSEEADIEYGRVTLGSYMYASGDQLDHWTMVTTKPYEAVTKWHRLTSGDGRSH